MSTAKTIAVALDLFQPFEWHHKTYAGTQKYSRDVGHWECVIDEFPELSLPARRTKDLPYDGIIARATKPMAAAARRLQIPIVNVWFNSPVRDLPGVYADSAAAGRLCADHLLGRGFRRFGYLIQPGDTNQKLELREFSTRVAEHGYECRHVKLPRIHRPGRQMVGDAEDHERLAGLPHAAGGNLHPRATPCPAG